MRIVVAISLLLAACGRLGFSDPPGADARDPSGDGPTGDGPTGDGIDIDAPIDGMVVGPGTTIFGETPGAGVANVTADTSISDESGSTMNNRGASTSVKCEGSEGHVLLRFDLSAIAPSTPITAAQLHLQFSGSPGTVTIRPILESWTEGTQTGTPGVANNVQRTASASWTTPGANAPGSAGATIASLGGVSGANTVAVPAATIQGWVNAPNTNFGVLIVCSGDTNLSAREDATATARPQLDVTHQ